MLMAVGIIRGVEMGEGRGNRISTFVSLASSQYRASRHAVMAILSGPFQ